MTLENQEKRCPLCHQLNGCGQPKSAGDPCWCFNKKGAFSKALLDQVPKELKGKACICQRCAEAFEEKNTIIHRG